MAGALPPRSPTITTSAANSSMTTDRGERWRTEEIGARNGANAVRGGGVRTPCREGLALPAQQARPRGCHQVDKAYFEHHDHHAMVGVMRLLYRALGHGRGIALGSRSNSDWDGAGLAPDHAPAGPATARPRAARSSRKLGVYAIGFF